MMTPSSNKDNKDGNSKNNDKAMMTPKTTTEGGEHCQSSGNNGAEAMIVVPGTAPLRPLVVTRFCWILLFPGRDVYSLLSWE